MNREDLVELLNPESIDLLESLPDWQSGSDVVRTVSRLRAAGHSAERIAVVLSQAKLRKRAKAKFGEFAGRMLFTEAGLEQATRLSVAAIHAKRFLDAKVSRLADLGSGIGGDSMAFAALGLEVTAIEQDEVTAAIATYNLAPWPNARVLCERAEEASIRDFDALWLDPARRSESRRFSDPEQWSPSLEFVFELSKQLPTGVKLAPGLDRDLIPDDAEAQWISAEGTVVELVLWFGELARDRVRRSALVIRDGRSNELTSSGDSEDAELGDLGTYLYEPDGAVIRARLIGDLARSLSANMISPDIAWMSSELKVDSPFASRFKVLEVQGFKIASLKKRLAELQIGELEIKKRGIDVDPAQLRESLKLRGAESATLILTRLAGKRVAILANREQPEMN
ncbi:MAG: class I SAM-dependent methyltransferase [Homoserinimonas sp.]|nr:class I SAM-dependent methyltransferase [Homoserinimonas sp.]MCW5944657.1 class I SAM-dependent methyltransferase [Cryobacterium sp.]